MGQWSRPIDCTRADSILIYKSLLSFFVKNKIRTQTRRATARRLALDLGVPTSRITDILNERR